ncbi:MAG: hypothetical protein QM706_06495 [Nitrospira sp.]
MVEEIVKTSKGTTCGRGSVAASIVSYCLTITHVDPIKHNLFFERFLNPGRKDPPDIDIDFAWDERDDILGWVFARYGERQAAMVANQNSLNFRAAIREVAKVYGMSAKEIGRMSSRVVRQKNLLGFATPPTTEQWLHRLAHTLRMNAPWPDILAQALKAQNVSAICPCTAVESSSYRRKSGAMCRWNIRPRACRSSSGKRTRRKMPGS